MADNARETVDPVRSRSDHRRAEGHQRQLRHFEALLSDGDTKDRDAPETTKNDIADRHFKAEEYDPDQVHQKGKPAAPIYDLFSEREKGETCKLEALQSDGNTDDGARCKILCKRFSTKSRMALESRADSGLNPLITESHGGQSGMRAGTA